MDLLRIEAETAVDDLGELDCLIREKYPLILARPHAMRSSGHVTEIIVALGSAGVFAALVDSMKAYFVRQQSRKLTITTKNGTFVLEGTDPAQLPNILRDALRKLSPHRAGDSDDPDEVP
jgi:hypothetical protein